MCRCLCVYRDKTFDIVTVSVLDWLHGTSEPLNSGDDVSDEEDQELFDTENVVVCQYDKIHRSKNKWKFHLKDGIMNLNGRDYVFSKAIGDAEW
ncbi:hypothetical protein PDJAM_G00101590 [Pangasius djambal]|uniref:Uncharacterized protein n=1 Tax=Pangasius djambal TaxID=1691987 RepID=A0ACC5Z7E2_9TELE|nr:hypothetical protein [Pangasius djambal]